MKHHAGISSVVQWLRLQAPSAGGLGLIPGQEIRSHMTQLSICVPQLKILRATMKRTHILYTTLCLDKDLEQPKKKPNFFKEVSCKYNLPTNKTTWASLVAQLVKNLPVIRETWVRSLGWEDPLQKRKATHSSILAWRIPWTV